LEEEVYEEEKEEDMTHPKLGDVLEPLNDDSNTQYQNSVAIYKAPYTFCAGIRNHENPSYDDAPMMASNSTNEIIDNKECCLDMLYDTALDDDPMLIDNPPCLHEDRNEILVIHDDVLIHESPMLGDLVQHVRDLDGTGEPGSGIHNHRRLAFSFLRVALLS
jgi:hypothetical protein